jgi:ATP-dependent Clp protease adaptor protein ClpS
MRTGYVGMVEPACSCETWGVVMVSVPVEVAPDEQVEEVVETQRPWITIVWNDPINLMSYVTYVFMTYFHHSREKAEKLMNDVHHEGRAVVSSGTREEMERDVSAMHSYGLWATMQRDD